MTKPICQHHLYWHLPNKQVFHLEFENHLFTQPSDHRSIWALRRKFPQFKDYLYAWSKKNPGSRNFQNLSFSYQHLEQALFNLKNSISSDHRLLKSAAFSLFKLGSANYLNSFKPFLKELKPMLTSNYIELLTKIDTNIHRTHELIFDRCEPHLYLWKPSKLINPERLLICFTTNSGGLNMPKPIGHLLLSKLDTAILYVFNPNKKTVLEGLDSMGIDKTTALLQYVIEKEGYKDVRALGTSRGAYEAHLYIKPLNITKLANFSGVTVSNQPDVAIWKLREKCPDTKILSILSKNNLEDQQILKECQESNYATDLMLLDSDSHGTFTGAYLENKLPEILNWVIR